MRLLERHNDTLNLTDDLPEDDIPPYAILSHTWGHRNDEVNYQDMVNGTGESKAGYKKIQFCGEQAARDHLKYFWVDSCCIDKSNAVELQEAIISMFRWYQRATKCYVYLADVNCYLLDLADINPEYQQQWEKHFQSSKWFTRGWTLQELLAPRVVEFFDFAERLIGDKKGLEGLITETTGVAVDALRGAPMSQFSVDERFSWATTRYTTRGEDEAYSLLGIFGLSMPVLYGEGRESAFDRLSERIDEAPKRNRRWMPERRTRDWSAWWIFEGHRSSIHSIAFWPNNKTLCSGSLDGNHKLWDCRSGAALRTLEDHKAVVNCTAFSPDGDMLASGRSDGTISLWSGQSGEMQQLLQADQDSIHAVVFSPDGKVLASGGSNYTIKLWDGRSKIPLRKLHDKFPLHPYAVLALEFSADGEKLASSTDDIRLWDARSGALLWRLENNVTVISLAFSPDGKMLASGTRASTIIVVESASGAAMYTLNGHDGSITALAFSPDGTILASGSDDSTIKLWSGRTQMQTLKGHTRGVSYLAFSSDGTSLASGSLDTTVRLWSKFA